LGQRVSVHGSAAFIAWLLKEGDTWQCGGDADKLFAWFKDLLPEDAEVAPLQLCNLQLGPPKLLYSVVSSHS